MKSVISSACPRCMKCWYYKHGQCKGLLHYERPDCLGWYEENLYLATYSGVKVRTFFKKDKRKQKSKKKGKRP